MRLIVFHTACSETWRDLYQDLVHYGVLVDVVTGPPSKAKLSTMLGDRQMTALAFQGAWASPVVRIGNDRQWPVIGLCADSADWYAILSGGLTRFVDLYVFRDREILGWVNRNVNHVIVEGAGDAGVLNAVLRNLLRHHPGRQAPFAARETERSKAAKQVRMLCAETHGEAPSFLEEQLFLDGTHGPKERELLVRKLPRFLADPAGLLRELRAS